MATTWLITRESVDAHAPNAIAVPCVETRLLLWPWNESISLSLGRQGLGADGTEGRSSAGVKGVQICFFTSRRAVASWSAAGRPTLGEVAALSPATSAALEAEGIKPLMTSGGGAVALAQTLRSWWLANGRPRLQVRYPTSDAGQRSAEQAEALHLLEELGTVDRRLAYAIAAPAGLRESLERAARGDWAISFASPSAVQHFFAAGAVLSAPRQVNCQGASTERAWNTARPDGWPDAFNTQESSPTEEVAT